MLLTDGCPNTVEDLRVYESGILDVASTEFIDLKVKLGLAAEEIGEEILDFLLREGRSGDPRGGSRRTWGVRDVFVTKQVKRWHVVQTLMAVYRDGLHNQLNPRYRDQFEEYGRLARQAKGQALRFGIGVVANPVPAAMVPEVTDVASGAGAATYYIRVSWVNAAGEEGGPGELTAFEAASGRSPVVHVVEAPEGAAGFHVYAGITPDALYRQNTELIEAGQSFTIPVNLAAEIEAGTGQQPGTYVIGTPVLGRG